MMDSGQDVTVASVPLSPLLAFKIPTGRICFQFFFLNLGQQSELLIMMKCAGSASPSQVMQIPLQTQQTADTDSGSCPVGFPECVLT